MSGPSARPIFNQVTVSKTCWMWTGTKDRDGYGSVHVYRPDGVRTTARAHRLIYERLVGPIPKGLTLDHLCRVRACVNPAHMRPCTNRDNVLAPGSLSFAAANASKASCKRGHPFDKDNTIIAKRRNGTQRKCRACLLMGKQVWPSWRSRRNP